MGAQDSISSTAAALQARSPGPDPPSSTTSSGGGSNTAQAKQNGNPVSSGEAAGIGIGSAFGGAIIAALVVWLIMRKRNKFNKRERQHYSRKVISRSGGTDVEKANSSKPWGQDIGHGPALSLEDALLERADDSQLRKLMQDLNELIDQHVENHYHELPFGGSPDSLKRKLAKCGYSDSTEPSTQEITDLVLNPANRFAAIRQVIAKVILGHIDCMTRSEFSLLPQQIAAFCQTIPPVERQLGCDEVFERAIIKWRHLSAFLIEPTRTNREAPKLTSEEGLGGAVDRNLVLMMQVLSPFAKTKPDAQSEQKDNLHAIIFEGAKLGILLFSQPMNWTFAWKPLRREDLEAKERRKISGKILVVFPALVEKIESNGRMRRRDIVEAVAMEV